MAGGVAITGAVGIGRVAAGRHFPTDVIAGATVGTGIGVLVPHLHVKEPSDTQGGVPEVDGVNVQTGEGSWLVSLHGTF